MSKEEFAKIMSDVRQHTTNEAVISHAEKDMANLRQDTPAKSDQAQELSASHGPKIGAGHAMGMARLGAHELTQILAAFPDSNVRPMEEPGVFGNENAPQRITRDAGGKDDAQSKTVKQDEPAGESKDNVQEASGSKETGKSLSLQDILNAPPQNTPPVQEQQNERNQGRER